MLNKILLALGIVAIISALGKRIVNISANIPNTEEQFCMYNFCIQSVQKRLFQNYKH